MSLADQPTSAPLPPRPATLRLTPAAAYVAVVERLQATRLRVLRWTVMALVFSLLAGFLGVFAACVVLDWALELPVLSRGLLITGLLSATGWGLIAGWQRWIAPYSLARAAIDVEEELDEFGQGLRTALDYQEAADRDFSARPAAALPALISALHDETYAVSQHARWDEVGPKRWLGQAILACLLLCGTSLIALARVPELRIAAGRMLLLPWQYTQVTYEPHQTKIKHGESVLIKAEITGRPIATAKLRYRLKGKPEWTTVELLPREGEAPAEPPRRGEVKPSSTAPREGRAAQLQLHGVVQTKLTNLQDDIEFEVLAGPVRLPSGSIRVLQPLVLKSFSVQITPPAYTKKPVSKVESRDFKVCEGSHVAIQIALNRPAATASLTRLDGDASQDKPAAEAAPAVSGETLQFDLHDLRRGGTFEITAAADDEIELQPQRFKIQVTLDRKPNVKWVQPAEQWEVTPTTEVTMAIAAEDDLGVHKAGIAWQVGSGELKTLWETDALGAEQSLSAVAALLLEEEQLTHRDSVTYYAFAEDNYFDQPRRTTTPLRFIDIRPYQQDFQLAEGGGGGGGGGGKSVTLEELIKREREQLNQSFAARDSKPTKEAVEKLAAAQAELKEQTSEFAAGIAELGGPVEPLEKAAEQMQTAASKLTAGEFDQAVTSQAEALAQLVKARENLRKKLNQSQSQSASQTKKFDRQQRQKLRLPEQKNQDQQQQLAQAKKQLDDLAKREREWSQSACQACQNASSQASNGSPSQSAAEKAQQKEALAKSQEEMLKELAELQKQISQNDAAGKTAQEQAARAAEAMQKSLEELKKNEGDGAKEKGDQAADRLDQLAAHLAAMNQQDVGQRLNQAQKDAARIANEQEQLAKEAGEQPEGDGKKPGDAEKPENGSQPGKSGDRLSERQGELAQQAKMLAEVLEKLRRDAQGDKGPAGEKLEQIAAEQKPGEIAKGMERTAAELKEGKAGSGKAGVSRAKDELQELAQALGAARRELSQPQLQELIKLEEQLAQLREQTQRGEGRKAGDEGKKPGEGQKPGKGKQSGAAAEKWDQLQEQLHELAESDKRLEGALRKLGGQAQLKPGDKLRPGEVQQNSGAETPPGHYSWDELGNYQGLDEIAKALQTKIQEAILAGALQDADEPVPPEYKALVEKYYRTLSDDLR